VASAYAVSQRDGHRAAAPATGQPLDLVFTVDSINVGPHYNGEPVPSAGAQERVRAAVECPDASCVIGNDGHATGPFVDLGLTWVQTSPGFYTATTNSHEFSEACGRNIDVHQSATLEVRRDPGGRITGLNGRYEVTHPGGVEFEGPSGLCSTFDISYTFTGTPA